MIEINFNWSIVDCEQSVFSLKIRRVLRRGAFWHRERFKPKRNWGETRKYGLLTFGVNKPSVSPAMEYLIGEFTDVDRSMIDLWVSLAGLFDKKTQNRHALKDNSGYGGGQCFDHRQARAVEYIFIKRRTEASCLDLLNGKDVMAILPTGFGKSMIFQLFTLMKIEEDEASSVIIVSPLSSITNDQVKDFEDIGISSKAGF